jgi:lectin-like protein
MTSFVRFSTALMLVLLISKAVHASPIYHWTGAGSNGHYYTASDSTMRWSEANALASSMGGYLVSIRSQAEQDFLQNTFFPTAAQAFWIGFTDQATEGDFVWTSGESVTYTNWGPGEPNDAHGPVAATTGEDYTAVNWQFANGINSIRGLWNDTPNEGTTHMNTAFQPYRAIIEFNSTPVPEPSPLVFICMGIMALMSCAWSHRPQRR